MAKRGALILFEGVDRCGKTTQAKKLAEALNEAGHSAVFMRFPGAGAAAVLRAGAAAVWR
jgi:dTMP kinase